MRTQHVALSVLHSINQSEGSHGIYGSRELRSCHGKNRKSRMVSALAGHQFGRRRRRRGTNRVQESPRSIAEDGSVGYHLVATAHGVEGPNGRTAQTETEIGTSEQGCTQTAVGGIG